jgi:glycosyltransferase involved in cell wall biosynthesis
MTTYLLLVLPRLVAAGHQVHNCFLRQPHESAQELARAGIETDFLDSRRYDPTIPLRVARIVAAFKPDVIHATQVQAVAVARMLRAMGGKQALVLHMHNLDVLSAPLRWLNHRLPQPEVALCVSKAVTVPSRDQYGLRPELLQVFYNAFNSERFAAIGPEQAAAIRAELGIPMEAPVVGRAARFFADKANHRLVAAMPEILRQVPDAHAIMAGDGEERPRCEAMARELNVTARVHFLGHRTDMAQITAACDVMTVTSPADNYPYAALESFALHKPVVGYRGGGLPEMVIPGVNGFLAEPDDHRAFADHVARCLSDRALRAQLGQGAAEFARRFTIEEHVRELIGIYEKALTDNRARLSSRH